MTSAFALAETALIGRRCSRSFLVRAGRSRRRICSELLAGEVAAAFVAGAAVAYAIAVLFLEPFYVAAGFAMYLNRRAELEAWDIEQEFRRAFAPVTWSSAGRSSLLRGGRVGDVLAQRATARRARHGAAQPDRGRDRRGARRRSKADPNLATERTIKMLRWKESTHSRRLRITGVAGVDRGISFAGSDQSARVLMWCVIAALVGAARRSTSRASCCRARRRRRARRRSSCRRTSGISTSARRASRPTSARPRGSSGIAASIARRWRCSIAGCCRGWRTSISVPIRDSSTEGDCLALAVAHLPRPRLRLRRRASCACGSALSTAARTSDAETRARAVRRVRRRARCGRQPATRARLGGTRMTRDGIVALLRGRGAGRRARRLDRAQHVLGGRRLCRCRRKARRSRNPFYATQRFAERSAADRVGSHAGRSPSPDAVIVLSSLALESDARRAVRRSSAGSRRAAGWSSTDAGWRSRRVRGVVGDRRATSSASRRGRRATDTDADVEDSERVRAGAATGSPKSEAARRRRRRSYGSATSTTEFLTSTPANAEWALRDERGTQACASASAAAVSRSSTRRRSATATLFDGDHALAVRRRDAVAARRRGPLPVRGRIPVAAGADLALRSAGRGALALALVALALWRGGVRFGPLAAPRRVGAALAGRADSRHRRVRAAPRRRRGRCTPRPCARSTKRRSGASPAIDDSVARERTAALARADRLRSASAGGRHSSSRRRAARSELRNTLALLEAARRRAAHSNSQRSSHGTD